jgi:hypothetical protein
VLMGEMEAGNNAPEIKAEIARLVPIMVKAKQLTKARGKLILRTFVY